ncbi:DUF4367 domain-containing protein [Bacillus sp. NTK074B]|uniref:DUF4367 domain-containing protein n=1 Tax=Bacillus sp. NTK074B TaxID=2802174 RepID=UPI001A8D8C07|nr:DUF4367 domain-containing protein [Bacillus sp. NTK074B]
MEQELKQTLNKVADEFDFSDKVTFKRKKKQWYKSPIYQIALVFLLLTGTVFTLSPEVRSMTEKWTSQVFHIDISSNDRIEIHDGYIYIDGVKTISEEKYTLAKYEPIYTENGYILKQTKQKDFIVQKFEEEELGKSYQHSRDAMKTAGFTIMEPSSLPEGLTLNRFYWKDDHMHITFQTENQKDLWIEAYKRKNMEGAVVLNDVKNIEIGQRGIIGKRPVKYWDDQRNEPAVKAEYLITFLDNGVQYELFGTNLSKEELTNIAKSMK